MEDDEINDLPTNHANQTNEFLPAAPQRSEGRFRVNSRVSQAIVPLPSPDDGAFGVIQKRGPLSKKIRSRSTLAPRLRKKSRSSDV